MTVFHVLYLLLFLCLGLVCFSLCRYYIWGDSQFYIADLSKLRGNYFLSNLKALFSSSDHMSLKTEGGFPFFLFLFSLINWELPFFVSGIFTVAFLFVLALIPVIISKKPVALTGILTMCVLLLIPSFARDVFWLSECLRDSCAHFWGFLGFLLCCIGITKKKMNVFWGAACIGIACWCRVPNILFVVPVGVYFLLSIKELWFKPFLHLLLLIVAGLLVGLLPLFGQNVLEGRPFYIPSQFGSLVENQQPAITKSQEANVAPKESKANQILVKQLVQKSHAIKEFSAVKKGMSFENFSYTSRRLFRHIKGMLGTYLLWLFLLCSIVGVFANYKLVLSLFSGAAVFFVFYGCYDKLVPRYAVIVPLFLLPMIPVCLIWVGGLLRKFVKLKRHRSIINKVLTVVVTLTSILLMKQFYNGFDSLREQRRYCLEYKNNIEQILDKDDVYICYDPIISSWTQYLTGAKQFHWLFSVARHWDLYVDNEAHFRKFNKDVMPNNDVFYICLDDKNNSFKYWSEQDLNLHYELSEVDHVAPMFDDDTEVLISEVQPRNATVRSFTVSTVKTNDVSKRLMLWTADESGQVPRRQTVVFQSERSSITNSLRTGMNIYDIPENFFGDNLKLEIQSATNLPIIVDAIAFSTNVNVRLRDYENMPATTSSLSGTLPFWYGKYHWARDRKVKGKFYIDPYISLPLITKFSVLCDSDMDVNIRVSTFGEIESKELLANLDGVLAMVNDNRQIEVSVVSWNKRGGMRFLVADLLMHCSDDDAGLNEFVIGIEDADRAPIFIDSIGFSFRE
jgi:hypothetical protein